MTSESLSELPNASYSYESDLGIAERCSLGRERGRFEEWENLTWKDFVESDLYRSPEAVVAYFLDHPKVNIRETLKEWFLDGKYAEFIGTHFANQTKLNPIGLAEELEKLVKELVLERIKLISETDKINKEFEDVLRLHIDYIPRLDPQRILFIPSVDTYSYIVHGISAHKLFHKEDKSNGSVSHPVAKDKSLHRVQRMAFVPMGFKVNVQTTKLTFANGNRLLEDSATKRPWQPIAMRVAAHESEHVRVAGNLDERSNEIRLGFKSVPNKGYMSGTDIEQRRLERQQDEGMTQFITIWKQCVTSGELKPESTFADVLIKVDESKGMSGIYMSEVSMVINDMRAYQETHKDENTLRAFLSMYYLSGPYPINKQWDLY